LLFWHFFGEEVAVVDVTVDDAVCVVCKLDEVTVVECATWTTALGDAVEDVAALVVGLAGGGVEDD